MASLGQEVRGQRPDGGRFLSLEEVLSPELSRVAARFAETDAVARRFRPTGKPKPPAAGFVELVTFIGIFPLRCIPASPGFPTAPPARRRCAADRLDRGVVRRTTGRELRPGGAIAGVIVQRMAGPGDRLLLESFLSLRCWLPPQKPFIPYSYLAAHRASSSQTGPNPTMACVFKVGAFDSSIMPCSRK